jgi:hypothetical protein
MQLAEALERVLATRTFRQEIEIIRSWHPEHELTQIK